MNQAANHTGANYAKDSLYVLVLGALGVVYGDIGTSPLYAFRECFSESYGLLVSEANILGILSLFFWSLTLTISLKYLTFLLKADNNGEGGILALMALVVREIHRLGLQVGQDGLDRRAELTGSRRRVPRLDRDSDLQ